MALSPHPSAIEFPGDVSQDMAGKIFYLNPWQDEKSGVACDKIEVALSDFSSPSDELVARLDGPCWSAEQQTCQGTLTPVGHEIFDIFANGQGETQLATMMEKTGE